MNGTPISVLNATATEGSGVCVLSGDSVTRRLSGALCQQPAAFPARDLRWLRVLQEGLRQEPYLIELSYPDGRLDWLPLMFVKSFLFGRYLVGMPYLNSGGVDQVNHEGSARPLIDSAVQLADKLKCNHLELRHETAVPHPALQAENRSKVHMRLHLPRTSEQYWTGLKSKLRSQIRKGLSENFTADFGGEELLQDFYAIFSRRMHELGTPVYGRALFRSILRNLPNDSEICRLRLGNRPVAAAILVHGAEVTEVPSASALTQFNPQNANLVMYWHLLQRAIERGSRQFDFGRSTEGSGTYNFKKQWGAEPSPAVWQYYVRRGSADDLRPDNEKHRRRIEIWKKLPLWLTKRMGPKIVRGIP